MKKKIAILGSTGSIGKNLFKIIDQDKHNFEIVLLTSNKNYKLLLSQAKKYKVKNLIIKDKKSYEILKKKITKQNKIKLFNNFECFEKIFKKKIDYSMSCIIGIDGLIPTINIIKFTKKIAIANKESIICGWSIIKRNLKKYKTSFIPVDSEHFSLWYGVQNSNINSVEKLYLTASGGPLYKKNIKRFQKVSVHQALNHPNWKMGKKITIDSATMINKVFEVIEAKNIFDIKYGNIEILVHPKSYVHALIKFNNGLIKIIAHDTTMRIPIFNTIYEKTLKKIKTKKINIDELNNLNLKKVDLKKFPMIKILNTLPGKQSLFETIIVSANDTLVELFLKGKINFTDIQKKLFNIINQKEFSKYKNISPKNVRDIIKLNDYVHLKILKKVYKA